MTPNAQAALAHLRDPSQFQWHVVPLLAFVVYVYAVEIERKNWRTIATGLGFYAIEWLGEIVNALWLHFSGYAPLWGAPGKSAYLMLVGVNVEISLMFAIYGVVVAKVLATVKNRAQVVVGFSLFCACVETVLNRFGALTWDYWWWGWPHMWSVILFAYGPATAFAVWVHDLKASRLKWRLILGIFGLDVLMLWLGIGVLGWI